jgi:hypothetical protein
MLATCCAAVWETEESDKTLLSWIQLAEYPLEGQ